MKILTRQQTVEVVLELKKIDAQLEVLERGENFMTGTFYADYKEQLVRKRGVLLTDLGLTIEQFKEAPYVQFLVGTGSEKELYDGVLTNS